MEASTSAVTASTSADTSRSTATSGELSSDLAAASKTAATATSEGVQHRNGQTSSNGAPIACNGCRQSLEETSDTVVVSFGEGLWHVDCRCAKCNNLVEHDTNLLLLADGSPVCEGCSYVCSYCGQSISNEAIVTGDESYHADCFRCKACSTRIEELVFAKTSQGIYCMACHNERVARTRKHAENKRNRSLRRNHRQGSSGQGSSSRSRNGASSSASVNAESQSQLSTPQASQAPHSPLSDVDSVPNSASLATTGHAHAGPRRDLGDSNGNDNLPEPPASLRKLRGMDKSPRLGDKETLHPKNHDASRLQSSPRREQEALYMSPSANSDKALPVIDGITEKSESSSSIDRSLSDGGQMAIRRPSDDDISRVAVPNKDHTSRDNSADAATNRTKTPALNIPHSASPTPSARAASPIMQASSPTNTHFTQLHGGLTAPRANASRNPNRRSGFYGAMAMPAGSTSPTGSGSVTPVLQEDEQQNENGYFVRSDSTDAEQDDSNPQEEVLGDDKALPVRPLAINRNNQGQSDRNGLSGTPSSSLSSVNTSGAGSTSSLFIPSTSSHTPQTLSASSSAGKNNHLSFYDPDVLVFLDAVHDGTSTQRRLPGTTLAPIRDEAEPDSLNTPTRDADSVRHSARSASSTAAQDGYNSDNTPDTTIRDNGNLDALHIRSRSLSPNPEQRYSLTPSPRQPRNLNLVANGHISTFSASTNDEDEEREMLSPLTSRRRSSGAHGLGLSTAGSQRSNKSTFGVFDDDDEEDESTKTALRRVRESIRQSRGASMSSVAGDSPSGIGSGMTLDIELVELLIKELEETKNRMKELQKNYNAIRRASRQAFEGFSMAREEYDREVQARREAEYEMLKLKKELQEQASKLSALNEAQAQQEHLQRQSRDLRSSVVDIEQELRKMKIERDLTYAEMEELVASAKSGPDASKLPERLSVALDNRLSSVKETYRQELEALSEERDSLQAEVEELRQAKDLFTDEGNELNKRNADLSEDLSEALKHLESVKAATTVAQNQLTALKEQAGLLQQHLQSPNPASPAAKQRTKALPPPSRSDSVPQQKALTNLSSSVTSASSLRPGPTPTPSATSRSETPPHIMASNEAQSATIVQKIDHVAPHATVRKFKWGSKKGLERPMNASISKHPAATQRSMAHELSARQHNFQPISILRPVRCESCGDKMWGMGEQRCQACGIYCHSKCAPTFNIICNSAVVIEEPDPRPGAMSIFGNDLVAQCLTENRLVPIVVAKCIEVVELTGMQYEGIYRKSGGMGQTKLISACFDRGDPFDLGDQDRFNDISAVTSVLKNYFRNLPNPLYTFEFHQDFCSLPSIKESDARLAKLEDLLHSLPEQHYATLRMLMLHLNRIHRASSENKMTPANLGVVFGPTLLRSPDPSQEFSQMHLKARVVELTVENAPQLFEE